MDSYPDLATESPWDGRSSIQLVTWPLNSQALLCCCSTCSLVSIESLDIFPPHFFLISNQAMELRFETKPSANMRPRFSCLWPRFRYLTSKCAPNLTTVQPCTQTVSPVIYECLHKWPSIHIYQCLQFLEQPCRVGIPGSILQMRIFKFRVTCPERKAKSW